MELSGLFQLSGLTVRLLQPPQDEEELLLLELDEEELLLLDEEEPIGLQVASHQPFPHHVLLTSFGSQVSQ